MAAEYDGSIRIDTQLDNKGFDAGSDELLNAIRSLTRAVEGLGTKIETTFSGMSRPMQDASAGAQKASDSMRQATEQAQSMGDAARQAGQDMQDFAGHSAMPDINSAEVQAQVEDLFNLFESGQLSIGQVNAELRELFGAASGSSAAAAEMRDMEKAADSLVNHVDALQPALEKAMDSGSQSDADAFYNRADQISEAIDEMKAAAEDFGNTVFPTQEYEALSNSAAKADAKLASLYARQNKMDATGVDHSSRAWKNLEYDIAQAEIRLAEYSDEMQGLVNDGNAFQMGSDLPQFAEMQSNVSGAEQKLLEMYDTMQSLTQPASVLQQFMSALGHTLQFAVLVPLQGAVTLMQTAARVAAKIGPALGKAALGAMGLKTRMQDANGATYNLLKKATSLWGMFRRRLIRGFFSDVIAGAKEGIQNLAMYSSSFNASMSAMMSSIATLKNSFAAAFAPILSVVGPVLQTLINWLSTAITYVGMFIAALTGKSSYTKATAATLDYAGSLDKAAGSAGKAGKAAKGAGKAAKDAGKDAEKAKKQLMGFDDVNILEDPDKDKASGAGGGAGSGGGGGGGGGGGASAGGFEEVPIDSMIGDFAGNIRDLIGAQDWEGLGQYLGESINTVAAAAKKFISWDNLGSTISYHINAFTTTINSLVKAVDWDLIGRTVGEGVNTINRSMLMLNTGIDWVAIGDAIGTALNGLADEINWPVFGQLLASRLNRWIDMAFGALRTFDFRAAGKDLGVGLNNLVHNIHWGNLAKALSDGLIGAMEALTEAVSEFDWKQLAKDIETFFTGIDWSGIVKAGFELMGAAIGGAAELLWTFIQDAVSSIGSYWSEQFDAAGGDIIQGLLNGLLEGISGIGSWVVDNIFTPFINGFKSAFGIASPSTVMAEQGDFIIQGLLEGINGAWGTVTEFFGTAWEGITGSVSTAWETVKSTVSGAVGNVSGKVSELAGTARTNFENMKKSASDKFTSMAATVKDRTTNIKSKASEAFKGTKDKVTDAVSGAYKSTKEKFSSMATTAKDKANSLKSNVSTGFANTLSTVKDKTGNMLTTLKGKFGSMVSSVGSSTGNMKSKVSSGMSSIASSMKSSMSGALNSIKNLSWYSVGSNICSGIRNGVNSGWSNLTSLVRSKARSLLDAAKNALDIHSPSRLFQDEVGVMISAGIGEGVTKGMPKAVKAIAAGAEAMVDAAAGTTIDIPLTANLDTTLTAFSDKITNSFEGLINTLNTIADRVTFKAPATALGGVLPYRTNTYEGRGSGASDKAVEAAVRAIMASRPGISREELRTMLETLFRRYLNIDFYIGDEKLAKHAQAGAAKINRRYGTT